jgi:cystathionine beta-lyase/cystathionine gamma-synthase
MQEPENIRKIINENQTDWTETPTNPLMNIVDLSAVASIAKENLLLCVDNTFASPVWNPRSRKAISSFILDQIPGEVTAM